MSKKRVHEIAKELKDHGVELDNKEVVTELVALGYDVKSHSSSLEDDQATAAVQRILDKRKPKQAAPPVAAKGFVVRRKAPTAPSAEQAGEDYQSASYAAEAPRESAETFTPEPSVDAPVPAAPRAHAPPAHGPAPRSSVEPRRPETPPAPVVEAPRAEAAPSAVAAPPTAPAPVAETPRPVEPSRPTATQAVIVRPPPSFNKESPSLPNRPPSAVPPSVRTPSQHPSSSGPRAPSSGGPGMSGSSRPGGPGQGGRPGGPGHAGRPGGPSQYQRGAPSQYQRSGPPSSGPVRPSSPGIPSTGAQASATPGATPQATHMVGGIPHQQVAQDPRALRPTATQAVVISRPLIQVRRVTPTTGAGRQYPMAPGKSAIGEKREYKVVPDHLGRGRELVDVSKNKEKERAGRGNKRGSATEGPTKQEMTDLAWGRVTIPVRGKKKKPTKKGAKTQITQRAEEKKVIKIQEGISVSDLGQRMGIRTNELIKKLMGLGKMATANQIIDSERS